MFISHLYKQKDCVFSIEVFPPKQSTNKEKLYDTLKEMATLHPDFMSVTYGAGGSNGGISTCEIAGYIQNQLEIPALAHLTCVGADRSTIRENLAQLHTAGVHNILALRGDANPNLPFSKEFPHASHLAEEILKQGGFCVAGACYPEGHPEAASLVQDVENLVYKQNAQVSPLITQLFFDNLHFYRFLNLMRKKNITIPVSAGIMPIVNTRQIERTIKLSSASLPPQFTKMIARWQDDPNGLFEAGIEYAIQQIRDLIQSGTDGIHLYAMNNPTVAKKVHEGIQDLL